MTNPISSSAQTTTMAPLAPPKEPGQKLTDEQIKLLLDSKLIHNAIAAVSTLSKDLAVQGERLTKLLEQFEKDPSNPALQADIRACGKDIKALLKSYVQEKPANQTDVSVDTAIKQLQASGEILASQDATKDPVPLNSLQSIKDKLIAGIG